MIRGELRKFLDGRGVFFCFAMRDSLESERRTSTMLCMGSMQGDDLQLNGDVACQNADVRGALTVAGLPAAQMFAGCLFFGDAFNPQFLSNYNFSGFVRNGVGDYTMIFGTPAGPNVAPFGVYIGLDGLPGTMCAIPDALGFRVVMNHLSPPAGDGLPVDGGFGMFVTLIP